MVGRVTSRYLDIRRILSIVDKKLFFSRWKGHIKIDLASAHLLDSIKNVGASSIFYYWNHG
jgi:hypothetical protein